MEDKKRTYLTYEAALKKMQHFCAYQDRCHQEVRSKLLELGVYGDRLEEVMADLIAERFLDEERFARSFARGKFRVKQWGRQRIAQELKRRHISEYCQRKAMEEIGEAEYMETIAALVEKKVREAKEPDLWKRQQKVVQYLVGRGFEAHLVWAALGKE